MRSHYILITFDMRTLQVRIPDRLRDDADSVLADIGLDLPTAVRLYLMKIVQTRGIPFALEAPPVRVEEISVTPAIQTQMDGIATAWKHRLT
jgi:DNA-damage-inducible protein J